MTKKLFKFYTNESEEFDTLRNLVLCQNDASHTINRAEQYGIPCDIIKDKTGKLLKLFLHYKYKSLKKEHKQALRFHKSIISKKSSQIQQVLMAIFDHDIPQYNVRLNVQVNGTSDWYGTNISINAFSYLMRYKENHTLLSLVWETALSQTFIDIRKKYSERQISNKKVWAISELTAVAIWKNEFSKYDWNGVNVGYFELLPYQDKITKLYKSRKNFDEFLDSAVKLFKNIKL